MTTRLITPPAQLAVTLDEAKANLRIDGSDLDTVITAWLEGITAHAQHVMGRSIVNQTWRRTLDGFSDQVELYNAPVSSVVSVKYYDASNVQQTLASGFILDKESEPGILFPVSTWPETYDRPDAVQIDYIAGYGADATATPKGIKLYILAKLAEQFDPAVRPEKDTVQSSYIDRLLDPYKVYAL